VSFHFGLENLGAEPLPKRESARRQRIAAKHDAHWIEIEDPPHSGRWRGWFTGPNLGHPFDRAMADAVLAEVREEVHP
jgi:hypothetical protein